MKVLFLDVDGVLNTGFGKPFEKKALLWLNHVVMSADADLVLTSLWRVRPELLDEITRELDGLWHEDQCTLIDWPRGFKSWRRGDQIAEWLSRHPEVENYAIVDDEHDFLPEQASRFVWTEGTKGLTRENADRLIDILGAV